MKKISVARILTISSAIGIMALAGAGCLGGLGETLSSLFGVDLLGVNPSSSFSDNGGIDLSMVGRNSNGDVENGSVGSEDCDVTVTDDDGVEHDCQWTGDDPQAGSAYSTITLVIDGSGSMEVTYPEDQYGDFCLTCPHDPDRLRVQAAQDFIGTVNEEAPDTIMSVMSFGPEPTVGWNATQQLSDFTNDAEALSSAVEDVAGAEQAGTPLYDSLAELILATDESAQTYEQFLRQTIDVDGNHNTVTCDPAENSADDTIIVDGNHNTVVCQCDPNDTVVVDGNHNTVICEGDSDGSTVDPGTGDGSDSEGTGDEDPGTGTDQPPFDGNVRRVILVLSDGEDLDSTLYGVDDVIQLANEHDVTIYTVGLGPASASFDDPRAQTEGQTPAITALQRLASETGGVYASVHDAEGLRALYANIADGLTQGYNRTTYTCDDPEAFTSGEIVDGTAVCNGQPEAFSFVVP